MDSQARTRRRGSLRADAQRNRDSPVVGGSGGTGGTRSAAIAGGGGETRGCQYRHPFPHFPTREALLLAVYRREMEELGLLADEIAGRLPTIEALRQWLVKVGLYATTQLGIGEAFQAALAMGEGDSIDNGYRQLAAALNRLLQRAISEGIIRRDIRADDLLLALCGIWGLPDTAETREQADRVVGLLIDGLTLHP
ncbi:TetR/AcrR family transcriptional regulator [Nocardia pseudovaccinii]|uniref:TetR/AcrR family transcriptional regulator n=1 Tax=Nocardia pseudovaccinii TaxID=189540 RepID=UPI003D914B98